MINTPIDDCRVAAIAALEAANIPYQYVVGGTTIQVIAPAEGDTVFYPRTERWSCQSGAAGFGIEKLITHIKH